MAPKLKQGRCVQVCFGMCLLNMKLISEIIISSVDIKYTQLIQANNFGDCPNI